jgi:hypothetical protein
VHGRLTPRLPTFEFARASSGVCTYVSSLGHTHTHTHTRQSGRLFKAFARGRLSGVILCPIEWVLCPTPREAFSRPERLGVHPPGILFQSESVRYVSSIIIIIFIITTKEATGRALGVMAVNLAGLRRRRNRGMAVLVGRPQPVICPYTAVLCMTRVCERAVRAKHAQTAGNEVLFRRPLAAIPPVPPNSTAVGPSVGLNSEYIGCYGEDRPRGPRCRVVAKCTPTPDRGLPLPSARSHRSLGRPPPYLRQCNASL